MKILYTADEHGWLLPHGSQGGTVALLSQWIQSENYCVPDAPGACEEASTVAVSGGDNWTGPAISSFFLGLPMARAMRAIGYVSSALGNHELDYGQPTVVENAKIQGYDFVAANVRWVEGHPPLPVRSMLMVRRNGVRIAIVGLSTTATPTHLLPSSYEGLSFDDEEETLNKVIPEAWKAGADAVVVTAHVCPNVLSFIVGKHPEWKIAFVGAAHCHQVKTTMVDKTPVVEPGAELEHYARAILTVNLALPPMDRVVNVETHIVDIGVAPPPPALPEPAARLQSDIAQWETKVDKELGDIVGFSEHGMPKESPAMVRWVLGAWRKHAQAHVAIMNRHGMRQDLPSGQVRVRDIHDILPFSNQLYVFKLSGKDLIENATCCSALIDGMRLVGRNWILSDGHRVDPSNTYNVVTPDFTYFGGAGFQFESRASEAKLSGDWREPVSAWMRAHKSSRAFPLENLVFLQR